MSFRRRDTQVFTIMKLVNFVDYNIQIEPELLLLKPFKTLHDRESKEGFMKFLSILYFTYDPRSDFSYLVEEDERLQEVCKANGWKAPVFNKEEKKCIEIYKQMTTTTSLTLLENTRIAVTKVGDFLKAIDMEAVDDKGRPIYQIAQVVSAIDKIPQLVKKLAEVERLVSKEITEESRVRGNNEGTIMD